MSLPTEAPPGAAGLAWIPAGASGPLPEPTAVGGKAYNLARLVRAGAPVPPFFVLSAEAFPHAGDGAALPEDDAAAERLRAGVLATEPAAEVREAIRAGLAALGEGTGWLAVRSSAVGEDGEKSSFAGQFETVLGVRPEEGEVWDAVRRVWASAFTAHALRYRRERGETTGSMAVVVQRLLEPAAAGVAFSLDPVTGDPTVAVVSAVLGLGEGLVSGALDADTYRVDFGGGSRRVTAAVAHKDGAVRRDPAGGVRTEEVEPALRDAPALSNSEARGIAARVRSLAGVFGGPQDVEWALAPGPGGPRDFYVLQARPVTAVAAPQGIAGERRVWDNDNIVESLPGVTLPLTYSVARRAFGDVYRQLCEVSGVAPERIAGHAAAFRDLFGHVRGRVLYNRGHRHAILALLPGLKLVGEEIVPDEVPADPPGTPPPAPGSLPAPLLLASRALGVPASLLRDTARLEGVLADFRERVARELDPIATADLSAKTADELRDAYLRLDRELLAHWHGPMLNDSLVEHWMGVLGQMVQMWIPGATPTLINQLVAGDGGIVSTEPVRRLAELGARLRGDDTLRALLEGEPDDRAAWERLASGEGPGSLGEALRDYLARFGDRCADELKLEALSYADEPGVLVRMLRGYASAPAGRPAGPDGAALRAEAEAQVRGRLAAGHQVAFFAVLERVRRLTRDRENLRFERTRAFGVIRRIFLGLGARLAEGGALESPRDVLFLSEDEVFAFLDGTSSSASLRPLAAARRAEFEEYARLPEPPDRFVTHGPPALSRLEAFVPSGPGMGMPMPRVQGMLRGMGCCPGVVRAPVRVVHDPRHAGDLAGRILVAQQTDPGWTLLFPAASGVLVQRGSILSHAALVAREMGIPCVVGIPGLLAELEDGDVVEMDGSTGMIRKVAAGSSS